MKPKLMMRWPTVTKQRVDRRLDPLDIRQQELALRGESVAAAPPLDQRPCDRFLQGSDTTLHGRLIDADRPRRQATFMKSGVVRVMELQEQGWTYVRP